MPSPGPVQGVTKSKEGRPSAQAARGAGASGPLRTPGARGRVELSGEPEGQAAHTGLRSARVTATGGTPACPAPPRKRSRIMANPLPAGRNRQGGRREEESVTSKPRPLALLDTGADGSQDLEDIGHQGKADI